MYKDIVFLDGVDDDFCQTVINFIEEWESYSTFISISSSGTTGTPKTIEFSKKQVETSARKTGQFFNFKKGETVLLNLSPKFVAGKLMIVRAILHEMKIVVAPLNSNPLKGITLLDEIKFGAFVPYQVLEILKDDASKLAYEKIKNVIIGGAEISRELEKQIAQLSNKNYATFGMTETLTHFALRLIDGKTDFYSCLPGISINKDERGCLTIEPNDILPERLVTNDCIELIDNNHFKWKGRIDNVINSGGVKIFPETDEKIMEHLFEENRFYLSSKKSEKFGKEIILILEGNIWDEIRQQNILSEIKKLIPEYHAPKSILFLDKFEETGNGKIIRKKF